MKKRFFAALLLLSVNLAAQPGKDGVMTINSIDQVVNRYSPISANISSGSSTLSVATGTALQICPGDLIMVYQAQGANISFVNTALYGDVTSYNSAGFYEFKYVQSIQGNVITVQATFTNSYQLAGRPQAIKVPQYTTLTINAGASIVPKEWKDTVIGGVPYRFGGLVVIHAADIVNNGLITATGSGFRGGAANQAGYTIGATAYLSNLGDDGGEKGESIFGYQADYSNNGGRYGRGAPANGGGGGNGTNSSGGGGGNGNNGNVWSGQGVMIVDANNLLSAWALDPGYIANGNALTNSSGGGRGGYGWGAAAQSPITNGPGSPSWSGDARREIGGLGGRPLNNINSESRIYFGGGGGAGQINNNAGSAGGNGGGIVYLIATNGITGTGNIESTGNTAANSIACNCDGLGGGGAGGSIVIKTAAIVNTQVLSALGGNGGSQVQPPPGESEGGGGGGGGGVVAVSAAGAVPLIGPGQNGTSAAVFLTSMTSNGGTQGASGQTLPVSQNFISYTAGGTFPISISNNGPLCAGSTLSLSTNAQSPLYSWFGPNSFTAAVQNPTLANATASASGIYQLIIPGGCSVFTTNVVIHPQPTVSILNITGSPSITCISPTVDLSATSNYTYGTLTYFWSSNSFTASTQNITVTNASTLITLTVVDPATGCSATATTSIKVNTVAPTSSVSPVNQSIGCGAGVVATATGVAISPTTNVTHMWYAPGVSAPVSSGGQISIFTPAIIGSNGTNTFVLVDNINGCSTTKTIQVVSTGGTYPTFSLTSVQNFSIGCTTTSLTNITIAGAQAGGGGVVSYTLLPPGYSGGLSYGTSSVSTYTVNNPGTYTVIVKDPSNNCETRLPVSIIQNTFAPSIAASAVTRTLSCNVTSVALVGSSANTAFGPVDFSWSFQNGSNPNVVNNSTIAVNINTATVLSSTVINTYTLTIRDQNNACTTTTVVTMWQNTRPPNPVIALSSSSISCSTGSVNLTNFSTTGILPNTFFISQPIIGLLWEGPTPQQPKSNSSTYLGFVPGTYTMTVKDMNNGCFAKSTASITDERDYPVLATTNSIVALDCGSSIVGVALPVAVVGMPASAVSATWFPPIPTPTVFGINTLTLTTNEPGLYQIVVKTTSNSCISALTLKVENGALTANFTPDQLSGFAPLTVNFTNNSASSLNSNSITTVWSFGNGTTKTTTANISTTAVYTAPGTYSVTIFASKGSCLDTMVKTIVVDIPSKLEVPNVFTPNGDGSNDLFFVHAANLTEITAQIFDRWGNKIYELTSQTGNIAWDGKNQAGKEVPDGTYFYTIRATGKDGQNYDNKGTVSLYR